MASKNPSGKGKNCPQCVKLMELKFRPFCSQRCAQLDLSKWLNEEYRVPVIETDDYDEDEFEEE